MARGDVRGDKDSVTTEGRKILQKLRGDRFQVVAKLGSGAFGEVYRARDSVLGRDVAIKRIRLDAFAEASKLEEVKQRFLREAQVAARLRHPNIVTTHDIVSTPTMSFIVMELVEGQTLQSLLKSQGRLDLANTIQVVSQVAAALDHAHENQVVHRDVKPANIMIEPSDQVNVMDFGIAKLKTGTNLTATGNILGTPNYMSPEQTRGEKIDGRSDLFSLACILYECLSEERAFKGDSVTVILLKILTEDPPPVDYDGIGLPPALSTVLHRAMAKQADERYASGAELVQGLRAVAEQPDVPATMTGVASVPVPAPLPASVGRAAVVDQGASGAQSGDQPSAARRSLGKLLLTAAAVLLVSVGVLWSTGALRDQIGTSTSSTTGIGPRTRSH